MSALGVSALPLALCRSALGVSVVYIQVMMFEKGGKQWQVNHAALQSQRAEEVSTHSLPTPSLPHHCLFTHCLLTHCLLTHCLFTHCLLTTVSSPVVSGLGYGYCLLTHCLITVCSLTVSSLSAHSMSHHCLLTHCLLTHCLIAGLIASLISSLITGFIASLIASLCAQDAQQQPDLSTLAGLRVLLSKVLSREAILSDQQRVLERVPAIWLAESYRHQATQQHLEQIREALETHKTLALVAPLVAEGAIKESAVLEAHHQLGAAKKQMTILNQKLDKAKKNKLEAAAMKTAKDAAKAAKDAVDKSEASLKTAQDEKTALATPLSKAAKSGERDIAFVALQLIQQQAVLLVEFNQQRQQWQALEAAEAEVADAVDDATKAKLDKAVRELTHNVLSRPLKLDPARTVSRKEFLTWMMQVGCCSIGMQ